MTENLKLRIDTGAADPFQDRTGGERNTNTSHGGDDVESAMRKALGLMGDAPRHRPEPERTEPQSRQTGTLSAFGGLHRRRFVQDGDVPVTVLRREPGHDAGPLRSAAAATQAPSNRLQRAEAALATETAARERAERALHDVQAALRDLQTKIGHAELARNEAQETLRREREATALSNAAFSGLKAENTELRQALEASQREAEAHLHALDDEKRARKQAEKAQKLAEDALDEAQRLIATLRELDSPAEPKPRKVAKARVKVDEDPADDVAVASDEPEPVKWWLTEKSSAKRR